MNKPLTDGKPLSEIIHTRIDLELMTLLEKRARRNRQSTSQLVRNIIDEYMRPQEVEP